MEAANILFHGGQLGLNAIQLILESAPVQKVFNVDEFLQIELGLKGAAAGHHDYLFGSLLGRIQKQPAGNIDHHIAHADDCYPLAHGKILRGKRRKLVVVINKILG